MVAKPVWQPVWQPVGCFVHDTAGVKQVVQPVWQSAVSCKRGMTLTNQFYCFRSWDFSPTVCWRHPVVHFSFRWRSEGSPQLSRILPSVTPFNGSVTMALLWIVANQNHFCLVHLATFVIFPQYLVQILPALWYLYLTKLLLSGWLLTVTWHSVITPPMFAWLLNFIYAPFTTSDLHLLKTWLSQWLPQWFSHI